MIDLLKTPLLKALLDGRIPFYEVMNAYDINVKIANLSTSVYGFVYLSRRGHYLLIINGNIDYETQCRVFLHEIQHILNDMPNTGYIIGLDMQYTYMEKQADKAAGDAASYIL